MSGRTAFGQVELSCGPIRFGDTGNGPPLVFVHGVYMNGTLWHPLVDRLAGRFRCLTPTFPLGGHRVPARYSADLSPEALAKLVPEFLEALDLSEVTVVANDTGGGLCLIALDSDHPGLARIDRLVLTNCDSYESFPPKAFRPLVALARRAPWLFTHAFGASMRRARVRRLFLRQVAHHRPSRQELNGYFDPLRSRAVLRDAVKATAGLTKSATLAAAPAIGHFKGNVVLAWGTECRFFPLGHAQRLAVAFPDARVEPVPGSRTYVMLDAPDHLATLIATPS
jgi:pimeloyl-ACP methyl ester carboxylesterase